jgi:hypothetical protein
LEAGTHLLHKPFTDDVLIRKVRQVLDGGEKKTPARDYAAKSAENNIPAGK